MLTGFVSGHCPFHFLLIGTFLLSPEPGRPLVHSVSAKSGKISCRTHPWVQKPKSFSIVAQLCHSCSLSQSNPDHLIILNAVASFVCHTVQGKRLLAAWGSSGPRSLLSACFPTFSCRHSLEMLCRRACAYGSSRPAKPSIQLEKQGAERGEIVLEALGS